MGEFVRLEVADGIGTIRLDRPPVNALNDALTADLLAAARQAESDEQVRAVIIYGGEKVFAAGADIKQMTDAGYAEMSPRAAALQAAVSGIASSRPMPPHNIPQNINATVTTKGLRCTRAPTSFGYIKFKASRCSTPTLTIK